jgi:hypothetical protein
MGLFYVVSAAMLLQGRSAFAQNSIDILNDDLNQIKTEHQQASSELASNFMDQVSQAAESPDAALALYQKAGGKMPDPTPVQTQYVNETPDEKAARDAQDTAQQTALANVAQLHCELMHYAALFVLQPDQQGLQQEWIEWLKKAAPIYPQLSDAQQAAPPPDQNAPDAAQGGGWRHGRQGGDNGGSLADAFRSVSMQDSIISHFLGFEGWGKADQGNWSVNGLPELYRSDVLEPLRKPLVADALPAWDAYIAMKNADATDRDQWDNIEYPSLMFDRDCDDYTIAPDMDKLQALVAIIKANPSHPRLDEMIDRTHKMVEDYRASHSPAPTNAAPAVAADPNVTVTSVQQGDMTVITTHTNSPPANPAPPAPPAPAQ